MAPSTRPNFALGGRGSEAANRLTVFLGLCQGMSVILMATIDMEMQEFLHILFSITTFVFGALAYLADVFGASRWRVGVAETVSYRLRRVLALSVTPIGLFFLYLFLEKANGPIVDSGRHAGGLCVDRACPGLSELCLRAGHGAGRPRVPRPAPNHATGRHA